MILKLFTAVGQIIMWIHLCHGRKHTASMWSTQNILT